MENQPATNGQSGLVLIVDDNPENLRLLGGILDTKGYKTVMALNARDAIGSLDKHRPDLILLDVMMPDMDGWDTIVAIKKEHPDRSILIAMLTAKVSPDDKMIGLEDYVFDYITKPFNPEVLIGRVNKYSEYIQND